MAKSPRLSELLDISDPPFVDVRPAQDNRIYIDPSAIRASVRAGRSRYAIDADRRLREYFGFIAEATQSSLRTDHRHGEQLLSRLGEPNETRLGMSRFGSRGKGMREGKGRAMWASIRDNNVCRASAVPRLEHVPLFVPGMGSDLMSDSVTQVIWPVLVEFTQHVRDRYPSLAAWPTSESRHQFFDASAMDWAQGRFELPIHNGRPLLLVPREFVSKRLLMNHGQFYRREAIETIWLQRSLPRPTHRLLKRDLHREFPHARSTNLTQALAARERGQDLVKDYEELVDRQFTTLTTTQVSELVMLT